MCEFAGKPDEFINLMKHNHAENGEKKKNQAKGTKNSNKNNKNGNVTIPCDVCSFVGKTAADYMKHIEEHNSTEPETLLPCELCDYKARTSRNFKEHIESAHGVKIKEKSTYEEVKQKNVSNKSGYCIHWNRGHCKFDDMKCNFIHRNIPPCKFQERCYKPECKFFHDRGLGMFPFLGSGPLPPHLQRQHNRPGHREQAQYPPVWGSQGRY